MCRQVDLGLQSAQNLQAPSSTALILQQQSPTTCKAQPQLVPGITPSNVPSTWTVSNGTYVAVPSLEAFARQALWIQVGVGLPNAPRLVQTPQWNVTLSGAGTAGISGSVDRPAIVYYVVCNNTPQLSPPQTLKDVSGNARWCAWTSLQHLQFRC